MILQSALTLSGDYAGPIDGAWGPGSRSALSAWTRRETGARTPRFADLGGLVLGWEAVVKAEDWSTVTLRDPGLSFLLPMRRMQRLKGRPDLIAFAARTGGLRVEAAAGRPAEAEALHDWIAAGGGSDRRGTGGRLTRAARPGGGAILLRSLTFGDRAVTVMAEAGREDAARAALVAASAMAGPGYDLLLPQGAPLRVLAGRG